MAEFTQVEKLTDCEYDLVDLSSDPCSNPPVFIDRKGGHVVCVAHADSLELYLSHQDAEAKLRDQAAATAYGELIGQEIKIDPIEPIVPAIDVKVTKTKSKGTPLTVGPAGILPGLQTAQSSSPPSDLLGQNG